MSVKDLLVAAKNKIANEANWTKGTFARTAEGETVIPASKSATCWCSVGALVAASAKLEDPKRLKWVGAASDILDAAAKAVMDVPQGVRATVHINDTGSHADVMRMFDLAIQKAEPERILRLAA